MNICMRALVCVYTCMYVCMRACVYVCVCMYVCVYVYVCMYVCACVRIYIHWRIKRGGGGGKGACAPHFFDWGGAMVCLCPPPLLLTPHFYFQLDARCQLKQIAKWRTLPSITLRNNDLAFFINQLIILWIISINWHIWLLLNNHISKYNSFILVLYRRYINYVSVCPPPPPHTHTHFMAPSYATARYIYIYIYIYIYSRRRTRWTWVVVTQSFTRYAIIRQLMIA